MVSYFIMTLFYFLFPALVIWLCMHFPLANKIGVVLLCYIGGMIFGNLGILPREAAGFQNILTEVLIALGISMLLFTIDIREWKLTAGKAILSFILATVSIIVVAFVGSRLFSSVLPEAWKFAGMAIGLYTGGTPNLAAIKTALNVKNDSFILMHTYDTVFSLIYIIFCASVAQKFFGLFLPPFKVPPSTRGSQTQRENESIINYSGIFRGPVLGALGFNLLGALVVAGLGLAVSSLVPPDISTAVAILAITTIAIGFSFFPKLRTAEKGFQGGMYLIYVFCTAVASMVRFSDITHIHWPMLAFVALCIFGSMGVHALLCWIFRIDTDTFIITSVSAICSPPFVPVVAAGLKNHHVLLAGITTGIIGYAVGNYLGISFAFLMR
jgi:uncharacterized membrane protein